MLHVQAKKYIKIILKRLLLNIHTCKGPFRLVTRIYTSNGWHELFLETVIQFRFHIFPSNECFRGNITAKLSSLILSRQNKAIFVTLSANCVQLDPD